MSKNPGGKRSGPAKSKGSVPKDEGASKAPRTSAARKSRTAKARDAAALAKRRSEAAKKGAATRARNAADKAKEAGVSKGVRLTMAQQHLRDSAVLACLEAGWTQQQTADELGCTTRTVLNARKRMEQQRSPLDARPVEWIEQRMRGMLRSIRDYRAVAYAAMEEHPSAAIGAMKAADALEARLDDMLIQLGKIPEDLSVLASQAEMERVQQAMVDCMSQLVAGKIKPTQAQRFFEQLGDPDRELEPARVAADAA